MANFEPIVKWLLYQEDSHSTPGKILNEGDDAGLTRLGITQRYHQSDVPSDFFSTMSFKDAVQAAKYVYRKRYWEILDGDLMNSDQVAAPLISFAVNDNTLTAVKTLQQVLEVDDDGHMGPKTLAELNSKDPVIVAKLFRAAWITFYQHDAAVNSSKTQFLQGWINRANFPYPSPLVPAGLYD